MIYCYRTDDGTVHDIDFPFGKAPETAMIGDEPAIRDFQSEQVSRRSDKQELRNAPGGWPYNSWAAGVHPSQRKEATEFCAKNGCPTTYNERGRPEMRSPGHRRRFNKVMGLKDVDGGYRD